jgi:hypothetical protein
MMWDDKNKKRLREIIDKKLGEIARPLFPAGGLGAIVAKNPNITLNDIATQLAPNFTERDVRFARFFDELGIEHGEWMFERENCVALNTVDLHGGVKGPFINIPKEVAEKILILGIL